MKKLLALLLVAAMCFTLVACGGETPNTNDNSNTQQKTENNSDKVNETIEKVDSDTTESNDNTTEAGEDLIISSMSGKPIINAARFDEIVEIIELTTDNWKEYIKLYSYDVEKVEKDAFGEITSTETSTYNQLGAGNERFHQFKGVVIELKDKETGALTTFEFDCAGVGERQFPENFNLDNYECTRIQGYLYFVSIPEDAIREPENPNNFGSFSVGYASGAMSFEIKTGTNAIYGDIETVLKW